MAGEVVKGYNTIRDWYRLLELSVVDPDERIPYTVLIPRFWPHIIVNVTKRINRRDTMYAMINSYCQQVEAYMGGPGNYILACSFDFHERVIVFGFTDMSDAIAMRFNLELADGHTVTGGGY
jgi:hypothetical protein